MISGAFESNLWDILVYGLLGLVQGLTEFLPVSSSGHLTILGNVLSTYEGDKMSFAIVVHFATALSTIVVFRKDIAELAINFFKPDTEGGLAARKYVGLLAISAIPAAIIGFTLKDSIEGLTGSLFVGFMLIVTAAILFVSQKIKVESGKPLSPINTAIIGIAQAFAMLPGISRSGSTIGAAILLGISRAEAAKFSFLMVLPVILGATALDLKDVLTEPAAQAVQHAPYSAYAAGFIAAFVSGLFACKWMIKLVKGTNLNWFAVYCGFVGLITILAHT